MNRKKVYNNRAMIDSEKNSVTTDCTDFECCHEELVFAMKDNQHQFSLGLSTVLECLMIAEKESYVPPLPEDWWLRIRQ